MLASLFPRAHARYAALPILGGILEGLCDWLLARGYPTNAVRRRVTAARLLERSLRRRGVRSLCDLTPPDLRSFAPRPARWGALLAGSLVRSLAKYLEERGELALPPQTTTSERISAYRRFLERVRGLAPATIRKHAATVSEFLQFLERDAQPRLLRELRPGEVEAFLSKCGARLSRVSMQDVTAAVRMYLRYLTSEGDLRPGLDAHIESPRRYRGERLPRALPWDTVRALLRSIDRSGPKGRRDYAMLLLVATYGLRVSEVAALELDDVAWRSRRIRVPRPKIGTPLLLPLTDEVATALLDYLRHGRPASTNRRLFMRLRAPAGPIEPTAVTDVFDAWAARAGIRLPARRGGPHCLRHSLAVHLLRQGSPLKTIGDLLGHRSAESTCVYLRLQVEDLRDVALPLPATAATEVRS